jgi:phosphoglycolate phosphatase-like HAD superfamily hydrolase
MLRAADYSDSQARRALRRIVEQCATVYANDCAIDLRPFVCPGVPELLDELRKQGAVLGLVSGNLSGIGWRKVELAGLREFFTVGAFAEHGTTRARLARACSQRARKAALVDKNSPVTLVGDHPNDVLAAKANGFRSVAVGTGITPIEDLQKENPDYLVRDLTELPIDAVF